MIDWLFKLPDFLIGSVLVATGWYVFNYAVLAERAMAKDIDKIVVPACISALTDEERNRFIPDLNLSELLGMPELEKLERAARAFSGPSLISPEEKYERCKCAANLVAIRSEYAIHTASFRIIAPDPAKRLSRGAVANSSARHCVASK